MGMTVNIRPEMGFLCFDVGGKFSFNEAKRTFLRVLEAVARHKSGKVFIDGRNISGNIKTMERFYYGEYAARMTWKFVDRGLSADTQFAVVLKSPLFDGGQGLAETVATNKGMHVRIFDNPEEARKWLVSAHAAKPASASD